MENREISENEARELFEQNNMKYFEVSAKENLNIDAAFESSIPLFY